MLKIFRLHKYAFKSARKLFVILSRSLSVCQVLLNWAGLDEERFAGARGLVIKQWVHASAKSEARH